MKRSLIVAQGLEYERALAQIHTNSALRLIVLRSKKDVNNELTAAVEKILQTLMKRLFPSDGVRLYPFLTKENVDMTKRVNFFDLSEALAEIDSIIKEEKKKGYEVVVDVSTGNKIVAIAMYLAAQFNRVPVTYCSAKYYSSQKRKEHPQAEQDQIAFSAAESHQLPILPLRLDPLHFDVLEKVAERSKVASISELVSIATGKKEVEKSDLMKFSRITEELIEYGYVRRSRDGRTVNIRITEEGRNVSPLCRLVIKVPPK